MSKTLVGLVALLLLVLASCAPVAATPPSTARLSASAMTTATPSVKSSVCQGLATIHSSLATLSTNAKNVTVGQVRAAQQKLTTAAANLASKIPRSEMPTLDKLKAANANLTNELSPYPDSTTLGEVLPAAPSYHDSVARAQAAEANLSAKLRCSP